jgi:signal transduction histidine kinase
MIDVSSDDQFLTLVVSDRGRGMNKEQINAIGAYMQFDRWLYEQQGSGLGLTIVKRLIQLHGGEFSIDSALDEGTTVTLSLPVQAE